MALAAGGGGGGGPPGGGGDEEEDPPASEVAQHACGSYLLEVNGYGTYNEGAIVNLVNYLNGENITPSDMIAGFAYRLRWADAETSKDDHSDGQALVAGMIAAMNSIDPAGTLKISLLLRDNDLPGWFETDPNVDDYMRNGTTAVSPAPWDDYAMQRQQQWYAAVANYQVPLDANTNVALKDHPRLANVSIGLPAWGPLNDYPLDWEDADNYSRTALQGALDSAHQAARTSFPTTPQMIGLWHTKDNISTPLLWEVLSDQMQAWNNVTSDAAPAYMQDNLLSWRSCTGDWCCASVNEDRYEYPLPPPAPFDPVKAYWLDPTCVPMENGSCPTGYSAQYDYTHTPSVPLDACETGFTIAFTYGQKYDTGTMGEPLHNLRNDASIGFQMNSSWAKPWESKLPVVIGSTAAEGLRWGIQDDTYNMQYAEVYLDDFKVEQTQQLMIQRNQQLCGNAYVR